MMVKSVYIDILCGRIKYSNIDNHRGIERSCDSIIYFIFGGRKIDMIEKKNQWTGKNKCQRLFYYLKLSLIIDTVYGLPKFDILNLYFIHWSN